MRSADDRALARRRGREAEDAVAADLGARGALVLGRNVRLGRDEIDIVVREGATLVVVEVRTRTKSSFYRGGAFASVGPKKKELLLRAAKKLLDGPYANDAAIERLRIDVAVVTWDASGASSIAYARGAVTA